MPSNPFHKGNPRLSDRDEFEPSIYIVQTFSPDVNGSGLVKPDLSVDRLKRQRILALQLGGANSLSTSLPALERLRAAFPQGNVTLDLPAADAPAARLCGAIDEVRPYDFFPTSGQGWSDDLDGFRAASGGHF